jgi:nucleoside-diphosphate-sugar epimerase
MNKILITGGAGYVGGYLTDFLARNGYDVTVYDSLVYEERFLKEVKFINGDIRDYDKLSKIVNNFDIIIWLAGIVGDGACAVNPELTISVNVDSVKWLVNNFKGKIIFPSTCSVYGVNNDLIDENAIPNPLSLYASTKLEAEKYIVENCNDYLIFRLGTLFGLGDNHSRLRLDLVVNILSLKATLGHKLTVFGGEQWRPLLHVRDVSNAILHGLKNNIKGLYNLSNKNYIISDIAKIISSQIENVEINLMDMRFEDLRNYKVKNDKFTSTGFIPSYDLEYGIEQINKIVKEGRIKNTNNSIYSNASFIKEKYGN